MGHLGKEVGCQTPRQPFFLKGELRLKAFLIVKFIAQFIIIFSNKKRGMCKSNGLMMSHHKFTFLLYFFRPRW